MLNSDSLRTNEPVIKFVSEFLEQEKPIAAICHTASVLIETGLIKEKKMTSYYSIKTDLINAGAE